MSYITVTPTIGIADLNAIYASGGLGYPWVSATVNPLPSVPIEQMFGSIVFAQGSNTTTEGGGAFIFLRVPINTTVTAGLMYSWGDSGSGYDVVIVPTSASSTVTSGVPIAIAINAVVSSATITYGTWFQVQGRCTVLKDAVKMAPGAPVYFSKSAAGRVRVIGSAFYGIVGMRSATLTTITTTTSSALMYVNFPCLTVAV